MSKSQENTVTGTARNQNLQENANEETSYTNAQKDVGEYQSQLAKFAAANPYGQGGQFQTAENQQLSDTAASGADAARQAMQSAAARSGANPTAATAAGEQVFESNARAQAGEEAGATQQRLAAGANYGDQVLNASAKPEEMEAQLAQNQGELAEGDLGIEEKEATSNVSYLDQLANQGIALGGAAAKAAM